MEPHYKLIYFDGRGIAEPIRFIFELANVPYEDSRFPLEEWPKLKESMPWSQVPVLEVNGVRISQSKAIYRFLGRRYGFSGKTEMEAVKCDEFVDTMEDLRLCTLKWHFEQDASKKEELLKQLEEETFPNYFPKFEAILTKNGSGYLVRNEITYADIFVAYWVDMLANIFNNLNMKQFPNLMKLVDIVMSQPAIKAWLKKRPQTPW